MTDSGEAGAAAPRPRARRWIPWAGAAVVIVAMAATTWWYTTGRYKFAVVAPGKLYRCAAFPPPRAGDVCRQSGIKTVIDLRKPEDIDEPEQEAIEAVGVKYVHIPTTQVPPKEAVAAFLAVMDNPANLPALVHCEHGVGRTGVMTAIYRMEYEGWDNERARKEAMSFAGVKAFLPESPKGKFVLAYVPRHRQPKP